MASNYNNALRLEMIGTGEQAGVWGETTNNNLGTLLVDAVAGYTSVSVTSANQALSAIDGLEDQSRNAMIALSPSGAVTTTYNVYTPRSSKSYVFYNTSGSYAAVIYNSTVTGDTTAAGTGVTIPAGKTMAVWSDGTNVAQQITHLDTPTIASPTISSPTVTGGSFSSPTLVTPALGTPASGVLTNATGLPIVGGTTGTLSVARGGTGVTTSTGSGNVVLSNSPTLVTPALGTPTALVGTNITGTASGLSIGGSASSATNATYATSAGSATNASAATNAGYETNSGYAGSAGAVAWGNVSSKPALVYNDSGTYSINIYGGAASATNAGYAGYAGSAGSAGSASNATYAGSAGSATNAGYASSSGSVSGGLVWRLHSSNNFTINWNSWTNSLISVADYETYLINLYWNVEYSYFRGSCIYGGNVGMLNSLSGSTQLTIPGGGSYGEQCYINLNGSSQHTSPPYFYVYWFGRAGAFNNNSTASATMTVYKLTS